MSIAGCPPPVEVNKLLLDAGLKGSINIDDYDYCFKSRTMPGLRARILHHVMHSKSSEEILKNKAKRKHTKQQKLNCIPIFELKTVEKMNTTQNKNFTGVHDTSNIRCILEKNNITGYRINSAHSLEIIYSQVGAIIDDVLTLVPRDKGISLCTLLQLSRS
jgi:hypothetical protein